MTKQVWNKKNPKPKNKRTTLTPAQKAAAKKRAQNAGRKYPNLVDNMAVLKKKRKSTRANSGVKG